MMRIMYLDCSVRHIKCACLPSLPRTHTIERYFHQHAHLQNREHRPLFCRCIILLYNDQTIQSLFSALTFHACYTEFLKRHMMLFDYLSGTQRVISFLRQMMEHGGFYRTSDQAWVQFERIQFVGACNPPTDPGRKPLTHRYSTPLNQPRAL